MAWEDGLIILFYFTSFMGYYYRIENRNKMTPAMLVNPNNDELKKLLTQASAAYEVVNIIKKKKNS